MEERKEEKNEEITERDESGLLTSKILPASV